MLTQQQSESVTPCSPAPLVQAIPELEVKSVIPHTAFGHRVDGHRVAHTRVTQGTSASCSRSLRPSIASRSTRKPREPYTCCACKQGVAQRTLRQYRLPATALLKPQPKPLTYNVVKADDSGAGEALRLEQLCCATHSGARVTP
eukprot:scaffold1885_cov402-Prasinococcus_capsulatus_cf.AAC.20